MAYIMLLECDRTEMYLDSVSDGTISDYDCKSGDVCKNGELLVAPCEEGYRIFWFSTQEASGDGTLFTLNLKVGDNAEPALRKISLSYYPENTVSEDLSCADMDYADIETLFGSATMLGDINSDGRITAADVVLAARYLIGDVAFTQNQRVLADVTCDGNVSAADVIRLAKYLVGLGDFGE